MARWGWGYEVQVEKLNINQTSITLYNRSNYSELLQNELKLIDKS